MRGALDEKQRRDFADAGLDGHEPDQLAVEFVEDRADARFLVFAAQIGSRLGWISASAGSTAVMVLGP